MNPVRITEFSRCGGYRFTLWREWDMHNTSYVMFIGLNPSTADATKDDPTIRKCIGFAKRWGFGALVMTNLFALRATDPAVMKRHHRPSTGEELPIIESLFREAGLVVAAWGVDGAHQGQDKRLQEWLRLREVRNVGTKFKALGYTKGGHPRHPLYVPYCEQSALVTFPKENIA